MKVKKILEDALKEAREIALSKDKAKSELYKLYMYLGEDSQILQYAIDGYKDQKKYLPEKYGYLDKKDVSQNNICNNLLDNFKWDPYFELELFKIKHYPETKSIVEALFYYSIEILDHKSRFSFLASLIYTTEKYISELDISKMDNAAVKKFPESAANMANILRLNALNREVRIHEEILKEIWDYVHDQYEKSNSKPQTERLTILNFEEMALLFFLLQKFEIVTKDKSFLTNQDLAKGIANLTNNGKNSDKLKKLIGRVEKDAGRDWEKIGTYFYDWDKITFGKLESILEEILIELNKIKLKNLRV